MSLAVKEGYVNPLTMMGQKENGLTKASSGAKREETHEVDDLLLKQQALQNQIVLLKSGSSSGGSAKIQKNLEKQLKEISTELQSAKTEAVSTKGSQEALMSAEKQSFDTYEKNAKQTESPGQYQVQGNQEKGFQVSFSPYSESYSNSAQK